MAVSCANRGKKDQVSRHFSVPEIPGMLTKSSEQLDYLTSHFWDKFLKDTNYPTDSTHTLAVADTELEQAMANYLTLLNELPVNKAQAKLSSFYKELEEACESGGPALYIKFSDWLVKYLYDPNSPFRSEDLYLPIVQGFVDSSYCPDDKKIGYKFELEKCQLNPYGSIAPDFRFKEYEGRSYSLHQVKADYIILLFSNPGCQACLEIINAIKAHSIVNQLIENKTIAVVNIYIDDELDKWRSYADSYPKSWFNCYDVDKKIKSDDLYYVRAIPSLYLLDKDKRIILKDAPTERMLYYFEKLINN